MEFSIDKIYTFNTNSPTHLGSKVERARFKGEVKASVARRFVAIDQQYKAILPTLPAGTPLSPDDTTFYIFDGQNGKEIILSSVWINEASIELIEHVTITAVLVNAQICDVEKVRIALSAAGLTDFTVTSK